MKDQTLQIPPEIDEQYEGRWIAWDTDDQQVVADGETLDEVIDAAAPVADQGHLIWYHHVISPDAVIVGGL